jgi:gluconolactonase
MNRMWRACFFLLSLTIAAQTPETDNQITRFSSGYAYVSALAWSREGYLLVADAPAGKISRIDSKGTAVWRQDLRATGLAFGDKGDLYVAEGPLRRLVVLERKAKALEVVAGAWEGKPLNGPYSVAATRNGHVYFSDPAFASADLRRDLPYYGIYHVSPKGQMDVVAKLASRPGGLAVSEDGKTLYAASVDERAVIAWSLDRNGVASGQRVFVNGLAGVPDGIALAPDGSVWIAAGQVEVFSPEGKKLAQWEFADKPAQIEFGEDDLRTAFVSAGSIVYRLRIAGGTRH